mgnify:CR=1 FL=1
MEIMIPDKFKRKKKEGCIMDLGAIRIITINIQRKARITTRGRIEGVIDKDIGRVEVVTERIGRVEVATERIGIEVDIGALTGMGIGEIEGDMIGTREGERLGKYYNVNHMLLF